MNQQILWRMAWKEYRFMRTFWLALAFIALVLQALAAWSDATMPAQGIFVLAAMLTACHALGCGGTAFAGNERREPIVFCGRCRSRRRPCCWGNLPMQSPPRYCWGCFSGFRVGSTA